MIPIDSLVVTHNSLRHHETIHEMSNFVAHGGVYNEEMLKSYAAAHFLDRVSPLIQIVRFEDGVMYIHDGHHRVVSCFLVGRKYLMPDEYIITDWKYSQYMHPSHQHGWYTPFDPRIHVRTPDFNTFKRDARLKFESLPLEEAIKWVDDNAHLYRTYRQIGSVAELAKSVASAAA